MAHTKTISTLSTAITTKTISIVTYNTVTNHNGNSMPHQGNYDMDFT
jgi:hypothetical protein